MNALIAAFRKPSQHQSQRSVIAPMVVLACFLIALLSFGGVALVNSFDREALGHEEALVAHGMAANRAEIEGLVAPQVIWGDAVTKLDHGFDAEWARIFILNYLIETARFDEVYLFDANDRYRLGRIGAKETPTNAGADFIRQAPDLIPSIRRVEDERARIGRFNKAPVQASSIVAAKGEIYFVVASRVQPDDVQIRLRGPHGPVVLSAIKLDEEFLERFAGRFLLDNVGFVMGHNKPQDGRGAAGFNGPDGKPVGWVTWLPQNPGAHLLRRLLPWLSALGIVVIVLVSRLVQSSRNIAQGLITSEARAAHLAFHDPLTGLANRVQFADRLSQALTRLRRGNKPLAVLCIDLDRFKEVNDSFGHGVGDELLKDAASRMMAQCREEDTLARLSGDEFAVLVRIDTPRDASMLAERLCRTLAEPFDCGSIRLHTGCSIGIAIVDQPCAEPAEILRHADIALYRAKQEGRGRYSLFEAEMDVAIKSRRVLEDELRLAIAHNQLALHYQPQVDLRGRVTGLEALVRWNHPRRGEIAPAYFVPIAEQSGLISELGMFTLRRAFEDSKRWPGVRIAVNVSANQLRDRNFAGDLAALVAEQAVRPENFDLEITESILLGDDPDTQGRLRELRDMGFCLALDDFGTGYSSLSYLHRYPIGKIKIDRSFIANLGVEVEASAVVDAIVRLAKALGLGVTAEGVETPAQFAHLRRARTIELQGFLFSRPVAATDVAALLGQALAPPPADTEPRLAG